MKITRDVITDLLPLYFSGEASHDTKQVVEAFFRDDPEFARVARENSQPRLDLPEIQPAPRAEAEALARTRRALRQRSWLMACAIFCMLAPFSFAFADGEVKFFMWRDAPAVAAAFQAVGIGLWIAYYRTNRRLRSTSL